MIKWRNGNVQLVQHRHCHLRSQRGPNHLWGLLWGSAKCHRRRQGPGLPLPSGKKLSLTLTKVHTCYKKLQWLFLFDGCLPIFLTRGYSFQTVQRISLGIMTLIINSPNVVSSQGVPISVTGVAQVKINGSSDEMLKAAAEQFGDKSTEEIMHSKYLGQAKIFGATSYLTQHSIQNVLNHFR